MHVVSRLDTVVSYALFFVLEDVTTVEFRYFDDIVYIPFGEGIYILTDKSWNHKL